MHFTTRNRERNCSKFVFIMTRLPAVMNVINNKCCGTFQARSWIIFHLQGKDYTRAWLAKLSTHRRRNINVFYTDWSIKRTIWLFIVDVYPVRYSKQNSYFVTGSFDFPNIANLCKQCYPDCESTGLKPVMDCNIPCIYFAQTQRWRMIISKYNTKAICYTGDSKYFRKYSMETLNILLYSLKNSMSEMSCAHNLLFMNLICIPD
jgi:hypothetical protein